MRQADVLLALGVHFDDRTSSSWVQGYSFTIPPTRRIHVDIDPDEIGRNSIALGQMARCHRTAQGIDAGQLRFTGALLADINLGKIK